MILHYNTKNTSFLKLHYILKEMGIRNNTFFLELYDEDLLHINPLDEENMTFGQKLKVHREIARNPYYFAREIVRIPTGGANIPFEINRGNLALMWAIDNDINNITILPRQTYKTTTTVAMYLRGIYWAWENTESLWFNMNDDKNGDNMERFKNMRSSLPEYLQLMSRKDVDNARSIKYLMNGGMYNAISCKAPGHSEESSNKVGRGRSAPVQWWDEAVVIKYLPIQYSAAIFAYATVAKIAERNNSARGITMTSTTGNLNVPDQKWFFNFINKSTDFTEDMYDLTGYKTDEGITKFDNKKISQFIDTNSPGNSGSKFLRIEYMYYDLGKDDNYIDEQRSLCNGDDDVFNREVLNQWLDVSKEHPLGAESIKILNAQIRRPAEVVVVESIYFLKFYKRVSEIDTRLPYIVGMDFGANIGKDYSTMVITDPTNFEVIATMRVNHQTIPKYAKAVAYIMLQILPSAVIVGESNAMGIAILQIIAQYIGAHRIYTDLEENSKTKASSKNKLGVTMTAKLRSLFYGELIRVCVREYYDRIYDKHIITEMNTLTFTKTGRIDHEDGCHDDTLMAYLYTIWFCLYAKHKKSVNVDSFYIGCALDMDLDVNDNKQIVDYNNEKMNKIIQNVKNVESVDKKDLSTTNRLELQRRMIYDDFRSNIYEPEDPNTFINVLRDFTMETRNYDDINKVASDELSKDDDMKDIESMEEGEEEPEIIERRIREKRVSEEDNSTAYDSYF